MYVPEVGSADRPAVRHALPSHYPAALRPAPIDRAAASEPTVVKPAPVAVKPAPTPAESATAQEPAPGRTGREDHRTGRIRAVGSKRGTPLPGPVVADRGNGPVITDLRPPRILVVAGEVEENGRAVPAVAVLPIEGQPAPQPPEKLPAPQPLPFDPKDDVPNPLGTPQTGQGPGVPMHAGRLRQRVPPGLLEDRRRPGTALKLEQAIELGVLTAREFQDRREDVYLTALTITLDRFNFAVLPLFAEQAVRQSTGRSLVNAGQAWNLTTTPSLSKLFPTGALLTAQLANQVVVDLGSGHATTAMSTATLNLMQPFLQGGGYAVTLEPLTQDERTLVYAMRSYARFRKLFFVSMAASNPNGYTNNPYGLAGLSVNLGRGIGQNLTSARASATCPC